MVALLVMGLVALAAGCAFESEIAIQFKEGQQVVVTESASSDQSPHRVQGTTTRNRQIVGIDCSITILYDVREATGTALLAQRYVVHLRTPRLPRGTAYELDCMGPLIVELPAEASGVEAQSTSASGLRDTLPVQAPVVSVPLAFRKRLRAEPQTQFVVVSWPRALLPGEYQVELTFGLPDARAIREKAVYMASVSCGRSTYLQPIMPPFASMARVAALTIQPSANASTLTLPHIVRANGTYAETRRTLSCATTARP
jgi:hypothetical protein